MCQIDRIDRHTFCFLDILKLSTTIRRPRALSFQDALFGNASQLPNVRSLNIISGIADLYYCLTLFPNSGMI